MTIFENSKFLATFVSNESWKYSKFKFDLEKYNLLWKICEKRIFQNFRTSLDEIFFVETQIFRKFFYTTPQIYIFHLF